MRMVAVLAAFCFSVIFAFAAHAADAGDVDGDGSVSAGDARLTLRAAVGLESLNGQAWHLADADANEKIEAADARMILRTAVGLEEQTAVSGHRVEQWKIVKRATCGAPGEWTGICVLCGELEREELPQLSAHAWGKGVITAAATCASEGEKTYVCTLCGETKTEVLAKETEKHAGGTYIRNAVPATCVSAGYSGDICCMGCWAVLSAGSELPKCDAHAWDEGAGTPATCTSAGELTFTCSLCAKTETRAFAARGHDFSGGEADPSASIICARCGKTLPSFNELVNVLKTDAHSYTGFSKNISFCKVISHKFTISPGAWLVAMMQGETLDENTVAQMLTSAIEKRSENWGDRVAFARPITDGNFHVADAAYVSALTAADVSALTVETAENVDFIASLPDAVSFASSGNSSKFSENIAGTVKAAAVGPVIRITAKLKEEKYSEVKETKGETALQRIVNCDLRTLAEGFNQKEALDGMQMEMRCNDLVGNCTVSYYFDAETLSPLAAVYDLDMYCDQSVFVDMSSGNAKLATGNMRVGVRYASTEYYFFDHIFE